MIMEKEQKSQDTKVIILSEHDKIDAEEYVEDSDHVYRKKDEVFKRFKFSSSNFWLRIACFFGLIAMAIVLILRFFKLLMAFIFSALQHFKDKLLNKQIKSSWQDLKKVGMVLIGLSVGVINPRWGMCLMSLFFSVTNQTEKNHSFRHKFFRFSGF